MPEYLAPGVFVEETSFRQKSIEGVSTSTTGFVGPTRFGPISGEPALLTSFLDFQRIYGGLDQLEFQVGTLIHNYLAHAVRAYFEEGGKRLYVARVFQARDDDDGIASWSSVDSPQFNLAARYPGEAGNLIVTFQFKLGPNILHDPNDGTGPTLQGARNYDVIWTGTNDTSFPVPGELYWVNHYFDNNSGRNSIRLRQDDGLANQEPQAPPPSTVSLDSVTSVRVLTVSVSVRPKNLRPGDRSDEERVWEDLTFHPQRRDSLSRVFAPSPTQRNTELFVPIVFNTDLLNGASIAETLIERDSISQEGISSLPETSIREHLNDDALSHSARTFQVDLTGGNDGNRPGVNEYEGDENEPKSGLRVFEDLENISIVAAPGSTFSNNGNGDGDQIIRLLISHCERMRYRVAILDSRNNAMPADVLRIRGTLDSKRAAFYYPWIWIADPITGEQILVPPSGSIAGILARNDIERGVHKAPANEVIRLAQGFEVPINKAQQEVLNPQGINCLRFFEGRGFRVWGARTTSSDPEWKYLNVRRYFAFLERSIEKGTQWAVFENNGSQLWANVKSTIEDFLFNEWKENHLMGTKPEQAYFVRCDRSTMSQNDIDNGRLVCLIGVAPLRPAEFIIFRIGQKTADSRS